MPLINISHADDARIEEFCQIRERDLIRSSGQFIAEGKVVLRHLLNANSRSSKFQINKLLILENRVAGLQHLIAKLAVDIPIYVAKRDVIDAIAGFPMHRGILALGSYDGTIDDLSWIEEGQEVSLVLIASQIANHDNMGSIFRNASAFGVHRILLDDQCCNPLYRKAIRVSVGATLTVPFSNAINLKATLPQLVERGYGLFGLTPSGGVPIRGVKFPPKTAIVIGAEGRGIEEDILSTIENVQINQSNDIDSLNVSMATGIALWHISDHMGLI